MKQSQIFRILAGILHLGNIELKEDEKSTDASYVPVGGFILEFILFTRFMIQ